MLALGWEGMLSHNSVFGMLSELPGVLSFLSNLLRGNSVLGAAFGTFGSNCALVLGWCLSSWGWDRLAGLRRGVAEVSTIIFPML